MDIFQIMALFSGAMGVLSTSPQIIKSYKTKKVNDLSITMFLIMLVVQFTWFFYGFHIKDLPVIFVNGFGMFFVFINIVLILKYRKAS